MRPRAERHADCVSPSYGNLLIRSFAHGWRSNEPEPLEENGEEGQHEVPRRFERLCYWALAEGLISPSKAGELLQQPRHKIEQGLRGPAEINVD